MIMRHRAAVFVFGENGSVLLFHRFRNGHEYYVVPGGAVEPGETPEQAAARELKEETAIVDAHFLEGFKETIAYFYRRQGQTVHKEVVFFIMESKTDKVTLSFEHIGYTWLDYQHAMEKLNFKNARDVLQKAHEFLTKKGIVKN